MGWLQDWHCLYLPLMHHLELYTYAVMRTDLTKEQPRYWARSAGVTCAHLLSEECESQEYVRVSRAVFRRGLSARCNCGSHGASRTTPAHTKPASCSDGGHLSLSCNVRIPTGELKFPHDPVYLSLSKVLIFALRCSGPCDRAQFDRTHP